MQLEFNPLIVPFVVSLIITAALGVYASRRQYIPAVTTFALLMVALTFWTFCYVMELASIPLEAKIFWLKLKYLGSGAAPAIWFVLSLQLTKHERWLNRGLRAGLWVWVLLTWLVVFTNDFHSWMWERIFLLPGLPETQTEHGFFFWVYAASIYLFIPTSVILYFRYYQTTPALFRHQAFLTALGGFMPLAGRIPEDFLGLDLVAKVDEVPLFFLFSGILFTLALFRYGALNILPIAHNLVVQNINAGIIVVDMVERVVELNLYARTLVGPDHTQAIGMSLKDVLGQWPPIEIRQRSEQEIAVTHNNQQTYFSVQISPIKEGDGVLAGHAIVLFDITARKNAELQLETLARTDPLTGVSNRRYFFERAEAEMERSRRYQRPLAVMMLDVDHFKKVNDHYGHFAGDQVLKIVATECQLNLRSTDIFARFGGEEFICLLGETSQEGMIEIAERIRQQIEAAAIVVEGQRIGVTVSVGMACSQTQDGRTLDDLIHQADQALYKSKSSGRNRVTVWSSNTCELQHA